MLPVDSFAVGAKAQFLAQVNFLLIKNGRSYMWWHSGGTIELRFAYGEFRVLLNMVALLALPNLYI